ncbi:hypothetical protein [Kineosporia sp. NBRC 101677]|uniref:hypothetical protein n=1 Tax=Kineosporia sp. NBRC 101677 TaxID=3032197 RepID=UPI0025558399|nr:hypothetical protein [Kineosporia sp. NBRC 101677]
MPADPDAMSLIREADVIYCYQQSRSDDAEQAIAQFRPPERVFDTLGMLSKRCHILRIGTEAPRRVRHIRARREEWITDTEEAMTGTRLHDPTQTSATGAAGLIGEVSA